MFRDRMESVGQFYDTFAQVKDQEVIRLLNDVKMHSVPKDETYDTP